MKNFILISILGLTLGSLSFAKTAETNTMMMKEKRIPFNFELRDKPFQEGIFYNF